MTEIRTPLVGLNMDADTAHYVGMLEGTIAAMCINEVKYRALLELLTGDSWEETRIDFDGNVLMELATNALVKQTGMSLVQAKNLVFKRWHSANHAADIIIPKAVSPEEMLENRRAEASERLQVWKSRQLEDAEKSET